MTPALLVGCLPILGALASIAIHLIWPMTEAQIEACVSAA
jgi:hypothetical protein